MMNPEDRGESAVRSQCGEPVPEGSGRVFEFGTENVLCGGCATARGGRYDGDRETWVVAPDLTGLPDESYGAAPHEVRRGGN